MKFGRDAAIVAADVLHNTVRELMVCGLTLCPDTEQPHATFEGEAVGEHGGRRYRVETVVRVTKLETDDARG